MAKLTGGLFSRPSGSNSGLTFGAGRTARAKRVTAREYVIPSQPLTEAQMETRYSIRSGAEVYRQMPGDLKRSWLKKAGGATSGFTQWQKMMFPMLKFPRLEELADHSYGGNGLSFPREFSYMSNPMTNSFDLSWSTEVEAGSDSGDLIQVVNIENSASLVEESIRRTITVVDAAIRSDGSVNVPIDYNRNAALYAVFFTSPDRSRISLIRTGMRIV